VHGQVRRRGGRALSPFALAAGLALVAGGLTACDDDAGDPPPPDTTFTYVALGDSFTATGLPVEEGGDCRRSDQNYPHLLADAHPDWELVDVSCGGASTEAMLGSHQVRDTATVARPQFDVLDEGTDLITISLGGNDFDAYWTYLYRCLPLVASDPDGAPCRAANGGEVEKHMDEIRERLAEVTEEAQKRSPDARVLFVGYPRILPDEGSCPRRVPVAKGDVDYVREMHALLVQAQRDAARDAGAEFVDLYTPSEGHDICSDSPWINDVTDGPDGAHDFHPMPALQRAIADLIMEKL
jgi:lysophospholipase L1-like esterase